MAIPTQTPVGLYQLTQELVYPDGTDPDEPDVPYTEQARLIWLSHADDRYGNSDVSPDATLYHPVALRDAAGLPMGTATFCAGMRCYAWYNRQSGRWEIMAAATSVSRIELTATLMPSDSSVTAVLTDDPAEPEVTVYAADDHHGVGRAGSETYSHTGTLGYAIFNAVRARWELLCLRSKLICEGKADETINTGDGGRVSLWWKDYSTGNLVDSGENVEALNWICPNISAGEKVVVAYDRQENRWTIIAAE